MLARNYVVSKQNGKTYWVSNLKVVEMVAHRP